MQGTESLSIITENKPNYALSGCASYLSIQSLYNVGFNFNEIHVIIGRYTKCHGNQQIMHSAGFATHLLIIS